MKIRHLIYFLTLVLLVILQASWLSHLTLWGVQPALYLAFLVWLGHVEGSQTAQITGFLAGIVFDIFSGFPIGFYSFIFAVTGFIFGMAKGTVFYDAILFPMLMSSLYVLLKYLLILLLSQIFALKTRGYLLFDVRFLLELGFTALVSPLFFLFFQKVRGRFIRHYGGFENG